MSIKSKDCFHCGSKLDANLPTIFVTTNSEQKPVCCLGCQTIAEHIFEHGLTSYYEFRTELANKPDESNLKKDYAVYQDNDYVNLIADVDDKDLHHITLTINAIHCAACAWLIEQAVGHFPGLVSISVNTINQRATLVWDNNRLSLAEIFNRLDQIGYSAKPFKVSDSEKQIKQAEKVYIKRLGVAGLFTMQIMMIAIATYFGAFSSMETHQKSYFNWLSLFLSLPIVFYSAIPFLTGALTAVKSKKLNMDVPVAIAIYGAFTVSFYQLLTSDINTANGEVFFESISMFTFLLLVGKYLEFRAKTKAALSNANLSASLPLTVNKVVETSSKQTKQCLIKDINVDDLVLIKPGEHIAIDGVVIDGQSEVNESVINGEIKPVIKRVDDNVLAGSINADGSLTVRVSATGLETTLANINKLQREFAEFKPEYSQFADKIAHWFVFAQLIISSATYLFWSFVQPEDALWISLSVLVATCPCALSLATPTAYTCVLSTLAKLGILVKDPIAFDQLNQITDINFDKTGTLTEGKFSVTDYQTFVEIDDLLSKVRSLQNHSEHPIAKAFTSQEFYDRFIVKSKSKQKPTSNTYKIVNVHHMISQGIEASIDGQHIKIGKRSFVTSDNEHNQNNQTIDGKFNVFVSINDTFAAAFCVVDSLKPNIKQNLENLRQDLHLVTGDSSSHVNEVASKIRFTTVNSGCSPKEKAQLISNQQRNGKTVMMIGDGINDAPVFEVANVSVAMGDGADISKQAAQIIILNNQIKSIAALFDNASKTRRIIKQNLYWSLFYNLAILPLAMAGLVPPYLAVIGMSASSILVVSNSLRLLK